MHRKATTHPQMLKHEFADGAASVGGSRVRLLATAEHNGLLQKSWQSISPDRKIERYVLADSTMHKDGQEWNFNSAAIPAEYSDAAQAIIWSEVSERALIDALADGHDNPMETLRSADNFPHFVADAYTSDPFAKAVHEAFINQWVETGKTDVVVEAHSTVTGQNYSMSCDGGAVDGTVRVMTGYEILTLQGVSTDRRHSYKSNPVKVLILDNPQEVTASAIPGTRTKRPAQMARLPMSSPHKDGARITLQIDSATCF